MSMEHAMVSAATGVLGPLIGKLSALLEKEYAGLKGVRKEIVSLREELSSMNTTLQKLAVDDDPDAQAVEWGNQIRDLSYDIEDCIDDFGIRVASPAAGAGKGSSLGFLQASMGKLKALGARHGIAGKIRELKARVDDVSKRRDRYSYQPSSSSSGRATPAAAAAAAAAVAVDPRLQALYAAEESLVGIDQPRDDLIMLLTAGGWEPPTASNLKVVSIVGFGGLGKTTLANAVHRKLVQEFDCRVFVSVSQNPDITKLLSKILVDELKGRTSSIYSDVRDIINDIRSHLLHKRYLVIIDDLWETSVWDVLKCAFPDNNCGSRVITTTRVESVAKTCCNYQVECIYKMNPLNDEDSRILFFNRIFGPGVACPSEFKDVSSKILEKCGGLPLAIITIASLLASQAGKVKEEWEHVQNSLGSKLGIDPTVEGMRQILNLSYRNLPPHLKTCFLYLGAYPEDCIIWKDDLVRQWIAEGFVSRTLQPVMDVAGYYFNELINRSLIQPVEIGYNDEVLCCRVHDMMLDLVNRKYCAEEKFMTMLRASQGIRGYTHNVRRLVNHLDSESQLANFAIPATIDLSKVRSLATIVSPQQTLCLQKFKFIRVLVLQIAYVSEETREADMSEISKLCLLRYLKIHSEVGLKLPTQIRALQHLETLEIVTEVHSGVCMPSDMSQLPSLSYLNVLPHMARLPDGVATMRSLHSLAFFILEESSLDNVRGLQCLTNLKELYLRCSGDCSDDTARSYMDALQSSVSGLGCKLYLTAWFPSAWYPDVPQWVSQLKNLHSLELGIGQMSKRGTSILGGLPALVRLDLCIRGPSLDQERAVFSGEGFPVLKHLIFTCKALCLTFQPGALPMLKNLRLEFNMDGIGLAADALVGVEHLRNLKKLSASIGGFKADASIPAAEREGVVSAVRNAIQLHPRCPPIEVTCRQGRFGY